MHILRTVHLCFPEYCSLLLSILCWKTFNLSSYPKRALFKILWKNFCFKWECYTEHPFFYFYNRKIITFLYSMYMCNRKRIWGITFRQSLTRMSTSLYFFPPLDVFLLKTFFISFKSTNFLQVDFDNLTPYHVVDLERKWISTYIVIHFENVKSELLYPWKSISNPMMVQPTFLSQKVVRL